MAATVSAALIAELESAADSRSPERWTEKLRQMTTLFLADVHRLLPVDYSAALAKMIELSRKGGLNDRSVNGFAVKRENEDVVAALSFLSGAPVEVIVPVIKATELDGLIVACKAARLNWSTTTMIIRHRPGCPAVTNSELEQASFCRERHFAL